jgi:hypothetical protein
LCGKLNSMWPRCSQRCIWILDRLCRKLYRRVQIRRVQRHFKNTLQPLTSGV